MLLTASRISRDTLHHNNRIIFKTTAPPQGDPKSPLKALVFDAYFDKYRGVILQCRVMEGTLKTRDTIHFMHGGRDYKVDELGYNQLKLIPRPQLSAGEVGAAIAPSIMPLRMRYHTS